MSCKITCEFHWGYLSYRRHSFEVSFHVFSVLWRHIDSVRSSVRLSRAGIVSKRLNVSSYIHTHHSSLTSNKHLCDLWDWSGLQPAQAPPRRNKCNSPPINGQYTSRRLLYKMVCCSAVLVCPLKG